MLSSARNALLIGTAATVVLLAVWLVTAGADRGVLIAFLVRALHVLGAIVWVGMIVFVNLIQIPALAAADDAGRRTLLQHVVPKVAAMFSHASHLVLLTGLSLLVSAGYLSRASAGQGLPPIRHAMLWLAVLGGLAMWAIVHLRIRPALRIVLGGEGIAPADRQAARERVHLWARANLALSVPVTVLMVAAPHLY